MESIFKPLKFSKKSPIVNSVQAVIKKITANINVSRVSVTSDYILTTFDYEYIVDGKIYKDSIMPDMFSYPQFKILHQRLQEQFPGQILHVNVPISMKSENVVYSTLASPYDTYLKDIPFYGKHYKPESTIEMLYLKTDPSISYIPFFEKFDGSLIVKLLLLSALAAFLMMNAFNGESTLPKLTFLKCYILFIGISIIPALSPFKSPFNFIANSFVSLFDKSKTKFESVEIVLDQNATEQSLRQIIADAKKK